MDAKKFRKFQEDLAGMIAERIGKEDEVKDSAEQYKEELAKLKEENEQFKAFMEKAQKAVGKKVSLEVPGEEKTTDFIYKGYDLRTQGSILTIPDEQKERVAKFIIDVMINDKASLVEGTDSRGGYYVPEVWETEVQALARLSSVAIRDCRIWPMSTDTTLIPKENGAVSVDWANEGSANSESEPTVAQITLTAHRLGAYSESSTELVEDSFVDILSWLTELFAEAQGQAIDAQVFETGGTFTSSLPGNAGATISGSGGYSATTYTDFSNAITQMEAIRRIGAKYYFDKSMLHIVRTMKDGSNSLIWQLPNANKPGTIYEYPYEEVPSMTDSPSAADTGFFFGNLKKAYALGRRRGMTMKVNPYIKMKEEMVQFINNSRWDGAVVLPGAYVEYICKS